MNTFFFDDVQYPEGLFGGKDFFNPIIYSTEEREIGVWTDNKPLYQKTLHFQLTSATSYLDLSSLNVENVVFEEGYVVHNNGKYKLDLPYYEDNNYRAFTNYTTDGMNAIAFYVGNGILTYYKNGVITIQYTKTTDTAGSGSYNTLGVPNVHYSTDEQVIGTWIDGKPLYQKTVDTGALPNTTLKTVAHNISNISKIVKYEGVALDSTGADVRTMPYVGFNNWSIGLYVDATNISIQTMQNWASDFPQSYVTIQYTKNTD